MFIPLRILFCLTGGGGGILALVFLENGPLKVFIFSHKDRFHIVVYMMNFSFQISQGHLLYELKNFKSLVSHERNPSNLRVSVGSDL